MFVYKETVSISITIIVSLVCFSFIFFYTFLFDSLAILSSLLISSAFTHHLLAFLIFCPLSIPPSHIILMLHLFFYFFLFPFPFYLTLSPLLNIFHSSFFRVSSNSLSPVSHFCQFSFPFLLLRPFCVGVYFDSLPFLSCFFFPSSFAGCLN